MAANKYSASVVVNFANAGKKEVLIAEIDSREKGYNGGLSSFTPGVDNPVILVYATPGVNILSMDTTYGNLLYKIRGSTKITEYVEFTNTKESSLQYPISSGFTYKWVGADGGSIITSGDILTIPKKSLAVAKVEYTTNFTAYTLFNIPSSLNGETEFPVIVLVEGEAP